MAHRGLQTLAALPRFVLPRLVSQWAPSLALQSMERQCSSWHEGTRRRDQDIRGQAAFKQAVTLGQLNNPTSWPVPAAAMGPEMVDEPLKTAIAAVQAAVDERTSVRQSWQRTAWDGIDLSRRHGFQTTLYRG